MVQAIILAAGRGHRLNAGRSPRPKCLHEVGGMLLIQYQLLYLANAGIHDVVMVVGFEQGQIRDAVGTAGRYVVNERFDQTNSLYSFLLSRPLICDDVVVMNADLFVAPQLLTLLDQAGGDALLYDSDSGHDDEHMKVAVAGGLLEEMAKDLPASRISGENLGMLRFSADTAQHVFAAAEAIVSNGGERAWLAAAVDQIAADRPIHCLDVAGAPWIEIDFPEDLARAWDEVLPSLADPRRQEEQLALLRLAELISR